MGGSASAVGLSGYFLGSGGSETALAKVLMPLYFTTDAITENEKAAAKKTFNLIVGNQSKRFNEYKVEYPNTPCKTAMQFMHALFFQRLFHIHPACKGMFPNGTHKMDIIPILAIFFRNIDHPEKLKDALAHFIDVHTRIGVKAVEFGIAGECAMHAIRGAVGPELYTDDASNGWCKIFSTLLAIIVPAAVRYELDHGAKAALQSAERFKMMHNSINTCTTCVRLQAAADGLANPFVGTTNSFIFCPGCSMPPSQYTSLSRRSGSNSGQDLTAVHDSNLSHPPLSQHEVFAHPCPTVSEKTEGKVRADSVVDPPPETTHDTSAQQQQQTNADHASNVQTREGEVVKEVKTVQ